MFAMTRIAQAVSEYVAPPGQVVFTATGTWTVPLGVKSISMVAVSAGDNANPESSVTLNSVVVCRAKNGLRIGDGGGDGGYGGGPYYDGYYYGGGGGGAGGYSGTGGTGAKYSTSSSTAGQGGGGGGGSHGSSGRPGGGGGGVGLLGQGANGAPNNGWGGGGYGGSGGGNGVGNEGGLYGGGQGTSATSVGTRGGALAYKNNVAVLPGQTLTIKIDPGYAGKKNGGIRIIWGTNRAYPSTNTGDL